VTNTSPPSNKGGRPRKRQYARGSVYFDAARDRWVGRLAVGTKPSRGDPKRLVLDRLAVYAATEREAWDKLDTARKQQRDGALPSARGRAETVGSLLDRWLTGIASRMEPESRRRHQNNITLRLKPALGQVRLRELRPEHLRALYTGLQGNVSPRTIRYTHVTISAALEQAVDDGDLPRNPAARVKPPKVDTPEQSALERDEVRRLEAAASSLRLGPMWILAVYTGAREGELLGAKWSDFQLTPAGGRWTIRRTLALDTGKRPVLKPSTKRAASMRTVPLPPNVVRELRTHRQRQREERLRAGALWMESNLVFCTELGTLSNPSNVINRDWRRLRDEARLPAGAHPHTLRHTFASTLFALGRSLPEISYLLGHASIAVTAQVYAHWVRRAPEEGVLALAAYYSDGGDGGAPPLPWSPVRESPPDAAAMAAAVGHAEDEVRLPRR
jgi:integrase